MVSEWIDLLREFGFPVFMVLWFMFRTEKVINENTKVTIQLKDLIENNLNK
jgi:hypothetical protein